MLDKLKLVEEKYIELCARAERPDFYADPKRAAAYLKEQKEMSRSSQRTAPISARSRICRTPWN